jgi:peptidyl-tRNA hydrolase, PTH1 family
MILIGLGNPGEKYAKTRHNVGWIVLDQLFADLDWKENKYAQSMVAETSVENEQFVLVKPQTFMNESGIAALWFTKEHGHDAGLFIIYDDLDLPVGTWKMSYDRGSGGHNGIKSIEHHLGTRNFFRIRIGIAKQVTDDQLIKPNVLGNFESSEEEKITNLIPEIKKMLTLYTTQGKDKAMTFANTKK